MNSYKINIVCLLLTNIFGCFDDFIENGRIVPSIISKINKAKIENKDINILSYKNTLVNLVFVDDISKIVEKTIFSENITGNIIVFNKNGIITLEMLTNIIAKLFDYKNNIIFADKKLIVKDTIMKPNLEKFNNFYNNFIFTDIETGLEITYNYSVNNCNRNII